jgi:hypothetical protein
LPVARAQPAAAAAAGVPAVLPSLRPVAAQPPASTAAAAVRPAAAAAAAGGSGGGRSGTGQGKAGSGGGGSGGGGSGGSKAAARKVPAGDIRSLLARQQEFVQAGALPVRGAASASGGNMTGSGSRQNGVTKGPKGAVGGVGVGGRGSGAAGVARQPVVLTIDSDEELAADMEKLDQGVWS